MIVNAKPLCLTLAFLLLSCGGDDGAGSSGNAGAPPVAGVAPAPTPSSTPTPSPTPPPTTVITQPLFPNSIVSNDLSFLELGDPSVEFCVASRGTATREIPGNQTGGLIETGVFIFVANFEDGTSVEVWGNPSFGSAAPVEAEAGEIARRLALLPTFMRETLNHVVLHPGDRTAFAEDIAAFFVVYADNMAFRRSENDMEETLFHESVHATMDIPFRDNDPRWAEAQASDPGFVTEFARDRITEDLAESAIFAFADKYHPGRLPEDVIQDVRSIMPARLAFVQDVLPEADEYFETLRPAAACPAG